MLEKSVPQGSVLEPVIFTLYINNAHSQNQQVNGHLYTDNTILYAVRAACFSQHLHFITAESYDISTRIQTLTENLLDTVCW